MRLETLAVKQRVIPAHLQKSIFFLINVVKQLHIDFESVI